MADALIRSMLGIPAAQPKSSPSATASRQQRGGAVDAATRGRRFAAGARGQRRAANGRGRSAIRGSSEETPRRRASRGGRDRGAYNAPGERGCATGGFRRFPHRTDRFAHCYRPRIHVTNDATDSALRRRSAGSAHSRESDSGLREHAAAEDIRAELPSPMSRRRNIPLRSAPESSKCGTGSGRDRSLFHRFHHCPARSGEPRANDRSSANSGRPGVGHHGPSRRATGAGKERHDSEPARGQQDTSGIKAGARRAGCRRRATDYGDSFGGFNDPAGDSLRLAGSAPQIPAITMQNDSNVDSQTRTLASSAPVDPASNAPAAQAPLAFRAELTAIPQSAPPQKSDPAAPPAAPAPNKSAAPPHDETTIGFPGSAPGEKRKRRFRTRSQCFPRRKLRP